MSYNIINLFRCDHSCQLGEAGSASINSQLFYYDHDTFHFFSALAFFTFLTLLSFDTSLAFFAIALNFVQGFLTVERNHL